MCNDTADTEIYTHSLHDALPISRRWPTPWRPCAPASPPSTPAPAAWAGARTPRAPPATWPPRTWSGCRSEEHTSELQSRQYVVCRLLFVKYKILLAKGWAMHNE